MAIATTERLRAYLDAFSELNTRNKKQPAWVRSLRDRGFARFCETGFPTTKDEDWRFTNVNAIGQASFATATDGGVSPADLERFQTPDAACRLVFVNGRFARELSTN